MSYSIVADKGSGFERICYFKDKEYKILHREDGPAIEWKMGNKHWYINGKNYSEKKYWAIVRFGGFI